MHDGNKDLLLITIWYHMLFIGLSKTCLDLHNKKRGQEGCNYLGCTKQKGGGRLQLFRVYLNKLFYNSYLQSDATLGAHRE